MAFTNFHPAPGLGELMPGDYVVPQNPITAAQKGVKYIARVGELLPGQFSIPENPIVRNFRTGMQGMGTLGCAGLGCDRAGFTGSLAGGSMSLGELDLTDLDPANWSSTTKWLAIGGLVLLILLYRPDRHSMKQELEESRRAIYRKYGRIGQRTARAVKGAVEGAVRA
jgi:hypothetical protein